MLTQKIIGPSVALVLALAVGGGIWYSNHQLPAQSAVSGIEAEQILQLKGLIGSEKQDYFTDTRVVARLKTLGMAVTVEKSGSRAIVSQFNPNQYDFGFPSGAPAAAQLQKLAKVSNTYVPFYTPMVLASWLPIATILEKNGVVKKEGDNYFVVDFPALFALMNQQKRWKELNHSEAFATNKAVLVASTDVRTSNSGAMYLALASYLVNNENIVQSQTDVDKVLPQVSQLFLRQGFQESSSAAPFEDYVALGMGKTPLLMIYESQLIEFWLKHPQRIHENMVMLYPKPTIFSKHIFVPFNAKAERLGEALSNDPELQSIAQEYGFRTNGEHKSTEHWAKQSIIAPDNLVDVIDPPSYEWLEKMISAIEAKFH